MSPSKFLVMTLSLIFIRITWSTSRALRWSRSLSSRFCGKFESDKVSGYKNKNKKFTVGLIVQLLGEKACHRNCAQGLSMSMREITSSSVNVIMTANAMLPWMTRKTKTKAKKMIILIKKNKIQQQQRNNRWSLDAMTMMTMINMREDEDKEMSPPVKNWNKRRHKAKSTPPDTVTWTNTYFRIINLYMCEKHRSDVSKLGQPPSTTDELDARRFRHNYIFDRLVVTYLDDDDDDCNLLAFFWKWIMGQSWNCCWLCKDIWCLVIQRVFYGHGVHQPSLSINWLIVETTRNQEAMMILLTLLLGSHPFIYYYHLGCARPLTC